MDEILKIGFKVVLEIHNFNHANSLLNIIPNFPDIGVKKRYNKKNSKELSVIYARLINQYKFKYHIFFTGSFYTINEEDQRSDEIELYNNFDINNNLT